MSEKGMTCAKCGVGLTDDNWFVGDRNRKYPYYVCKPCSLRLRREWRETNPEKNKEASTKSYLRRYKKMKEYQKEHAKRFPHIVNARSAAYRAMKQGKIIKTSCAICGSEFSEKHHPDYSQPLMVVWLCSKHHKRIHIWIN